MKITLLTPPYNYAICKMDERNFPGVVVQGDSLSVLYGLMQKALAEIRAKSPNLDEDAETVIYDLESEVEKLKQVLHSYEKVCEKHGFGLPYETVI